MKHCLANFLCTSGIMEYLSSIILDADATSVVQRVALRTDDIPLGEQTVAQVIFHSLIQTVKVYLDHKVNYTNPVTYFYFTSRYYNRPKNS